MMFTMSAVGGIKPVLLKTARALKLRRAQLLWTVVIPAALPEIFTGLRVGFSVTLIGTLLSEMFGSHEGLGFELMNAIGRNSVSLMMSLTFLLVLFAVVVNGALLVIEARLHRAA
jgi:NitT/TauT family transport system permease protein